MRFWLLGLLPAVSACAQMAWFCKPPSAKGEAPEKPVPRCAAVRAQQGGDDARSQDEAPRPLEAEQETEETVAIRLDGAPMRGPEAAPVTVVVWADFESAFFARARDTVDRLADEYGNNLRLVFKHFPLPFHPRAMATAKAAEAARAQGKFWEMHDRLFSDAYALEDSDLLHYAESLGLDTEAFIKAMAGPDISARITEDAAQARALGVRATPTFFVNGRILVGAQPIEAFRILIDQELAARQKMTLLQ